MYMLVFTKPCGDNQYTLNNGKVESYVKDCETHAIQISFIYNTTASKTPYKYLI